MRTIFIFGLGFLAGAFVFGGITKFTKQNPINGSNAINDTVIKTVNNPDGTVTYYYQNGGVVTETTNKK